MASAVTQLIRQIWCPFVLKESLYGYHTLGMGRFADRRFAGGEEESPFRRPDVSPRRTVRRKPKEFRRKPKVFRRKPKVFRRKPKKFRHTPERTEIAQQQTPTFAFSAQYYFILLQSICVRTTDRLNKLYQKSLIL